MLVRSVSVFAATAALLIHGLVHAEVGMDEIFAPGQPPAVVASSQTVESGYPEQSLAGFEWAIDQGVDIAIVGVQKTLDDKYIALRDATLPRTTNVRDVFPKGAASRAPGDFAAGMHIVGDYTLEEVKKLSLSDPSGGDHSVPTLNQVLDLIDGRMIAVLKLDIYDATSLAALLQERNAGSLLLFTWSDKLKLRDFSVATGIGVWESLENRDALATLEKLVEMYGSMLKVVDVDATQLSPKLISRAEELGVRLCLVGPLEDQMLSGGDKAPWRASLNSPVAAFSTKYPRAVLEFLGR